jgi:hypothetical protein
LEVGGRQLSGHATRTLAASSNVSEPLNELFQESFYVNSEAKRTGLGFYRIKNNSPKSALPLTRLDILEKLSVLLLQKLVEMSLSETCF